MAQAGYPTMTYKTRFKYLFDKATDIAHAAHALNPRAMHLPPLFFFSDPRRTPHPEDIATLLPAGCGVIYRHFGDSHAPQRARLLRQIANDHGLVLLIGEDDALAVDIGADGVHLREQSLERAAALHADHPHLTLTMACHDLDKAADIAHEAGVSAIFASPVFASTSPSAAGVTPLGVKGARAFAEAGSRPVYGLGGINCDNIGLLHDSGLSGVGAVDAFSLD